MKREQDVIRKDCAMIFSEIIQRGFTFVGQVGQWRLSAGTLDAVRLGRHELKFGSWTRWESEYDAWRIGEHVDRVVQVVEAFLARLI